MRHLAGLLTFVVASAAPLAALASSGGGLSRPQAVTPIPEPAALALFAVGALVVGGAIRRYRRSS